MKWRIENSFNFNNWWKLYFVFTRLPSLYVFELTRLTLLVTGVRKADKSRGGAQCARSWFSNSSRQIDVPKFINTSPHYLLVMITRYIERKIPTNFPKMSNDLRNEGIFREIRLILRNPKNYENWKNDHNLAIFGWNGSRFRTPVESFKNGKLLSFDPKNWMPNQTPGGLFVFCQNQFFFNFGDPWSCPGILFWHENGSKSKFI